MTHILLFALFFVLFASRTLGFDLSLAPGLSVKNAFLYVIFLALAIETVVTRRRKLELLTVITPFALYVGYAVFTWIAVLLVIDYPGYKLRSSLFALKAGPVEHLLVLLIFFYGIADVRRGVGVLRSILWLVIVGNVITVVDALNILELGLIDTREDGRVGGTIGNSNEYAAFLAFLLPAIAALFWTEQGIRKWLAGAGAAISGLAFLMAVSRGAIVGLVAGGVVGAYYLRAIIPPQTYIRTSFGIALLAVVAMAGAFFTGYGDLLVDRFSLFGVDSHQASSGRTFIWGQALNSMLEHPITFVTGFGWYAYSTFSEFGFATHNAYLNILYNLGAIGVGLFLLTAGNALVVARRGVIAAPVELRPWLIAFVFGFLALLFTILFGELHSSWLYVWAFVGISLRIAVAVGSDEGIRVHGEGTEWTRQAGRRQTSRKDLTPAGSTVGQVENTVGTQPGK